MFNAPQTLPVAMAGLRNVHKSCPPEVLGFLMDLFKYSDNSKNRYSDNYYRAALVDALAAAISPAPVQHDPATITSDTLTENTRRILTEVRHDSDTVRVMVEGVDASRIGCE